MRSYVLRQLLALLLVMLASTLIVFLSLHLAPGSPEQFLVGRRTIPPEQLLALRAHYHLDDPLLVQYVRWLGGLVRGDFGMSIATRTPVTSLLASALPTTLVLIGYAALLSVTLGLVAGATAALRRGWPDQLITASSAVAVAIPAFVAAVLLRAFFAVHWGLFPVRGGGHGFLERLHHLTLPAISLALLTSALLARVTRSSMREEAAREHVQTAQVRGLPTTLIVRRHILRNALIPVVTVVGLQVPFLIVGSVAVEQAFDLSGLGRLLLSGVSTNDFAVVQAVVLVIVFAIITANTVVDLIYSWLDPRIRLGEGRR